MLPSTPSLFSIASTTASLPSRFAREISAADFASTTSSPCASISESKKPHCVKRIGQMVLHRKCDVHGEESGIHASLSHFRKIDLYR